MEKYNLNVKKLNLDTIQDEIIDECFIPELKTIKELENDELEEDDSTDSDDPSETLNVENSFRKIQKTLSENKNTETNEVLVKKVQTGIDVEKSKELLILRNSGLVYTEAKKCTCNIPFQDKVQYGFEGLMKAIYSFNTNFKTQFSTYATHTVRNYMYRNGNNDARMINLPEYLSVDNIKVQSFINSYVAENQKHPSNEIISENTGIQLSNIEKIMSFSTNTFSIDTPVNAGDETFDKTLQDILSGDSSDYHLNETSLSKNINEIIIDISQYLTDEEKMLIGLIYGCFGYEVHSFDEVIKRGYTDENGKTITSKATLSRRLDVVTKKIRRIVERENISFD